MPRRHRPSPNLWTANQIVAFNVAKARLLRGWTQEEAAQAIGRCLGTAMSAASFSAIERSVDVGRVREFDADEILAFARAFRVPLAWFFTPPSVWEGVGVATGDTGAEGLDPILMLDAVLGTPETLEDYKSYLFSWPDPRHRLRIYADGRVEDDDGRASDDVHTALDDQLQLRAGRLLRDRFGTLERGREVLESFIAVIDALDESALDEPSTGQRHTGHQARDSATRGQDSDL